MAVLFASLSIFLLMLLAYRLEALRVERAMRSVPVRVGVTGTRGKSSVTRLVAAALRGSGRTVVAKTTGSRPVLIHADGTEEKVARRGPATILEQKKVLELARRERADAFVSEIMSVRPESQAVESSRILGINVCAVTNIRVDHVTEQGATLSEVARALSRSVPPGGTVVCPEGEDLPELREAASRAGASLRISPRALEAPLRARAPRLGYVEFEENIRLALEVCRVLGLEDRQALAAMESAVPDLGALRLWAWEDGRPEKRRVFVNAFAANDVESSRAALDVALGRLDGGFRVVGILNLRDDRGERTLQWIEALRGGRLGGFSARCSALYAVGAQAGALRRRLAGAGFGCFAPREAAPEALLGRVLAENPGDLCIVGLGNIAGLGAKLAAYCGERGRPCEP